MHQDSFAEIWALEECFWLGDAEFYERTLAPDAVMVLPDPAGLLDRSTTIEAIRESDRWQRVSFDERWQASAGDAIVLVYTANAERHDPGSIHVARCSSTYVRSDTHWKLLLHHQSLLR